MCSDIVKGAVAAMVLSGVWSCSAYWTMNEMSRIRADVSVSVPDCTEEKAEENDSGAGHVDIVDDEGPVIMNASRDPLTGEMVPVDFIKASKVVARFRNVAERGGRVTVSFDILVPAKMLSPSWQLRLVPRLEIMTDTLSFDPVLVTGSRYRAAQLRGYERYRNFLASVLTDSTDFLMLKQLEIFIRRHWPDMYSMRNDTSVISGHAAESVFGVGRKEALEHYTRHRLMTRNERRRKTSENMLDRLTGGLTAVRKDTVVYPGTGDVCYRYTQTLKSRPGLRKIHVSVPGGIYESGRMLYRIPGDGKVTFYISSLSSLADTTVRYRTEVVKRNVHDCMQSVVDFCKSSSSIDTLSGRNAIELDRIRSAISRIVRMEDFETDSIVVTASCSPEGRYMFNSSLADARARAVVDYLSKEMGNVPGRLLRVASVPENWEMLRRLAVLDTLVSRNSADRIMSLPYDTDPDGSEAVIRSLPEHGHFVSEIYPKLRTVKVDFHIHRKDMVKDTVHTSVVDEVYMAGIDALRRLDYREAVEKLGKYRDFNAALAYLSAGYDSKALDILLGIGNRSARTDYLTALALSRTGRDEEAVEYFRKSVSADRSMLHRGRLDPEISSVMDEAGIEWE